MSLATALRTRDLAELPGRRDEAWRWSDLRAAVRAAPELSPERPAFGGGSFADIAAEEVVFVNGHPIGPAAVTAREGGPRVLKLRFLSDASGTGHACAFALVVEAGANLTLLESYEGRGSAYVADTALAIDLGEGARLERIVVADEPADAVSVSTAEVAVEGGAHFAQTTLATGARLQRIETRVRHPGAEAAVRLDGLYLPGGRRHVDFTSVVTHEGEGGATSQLCKGVVADAARGVFQGRITVLKGADRTDARMGHHALLLSDRAEVDAKPELEIWADDVACAHGNTVGALDEEALFYIRSRGVPEAPARALLTEAFLGEVVERVEHLAARDLLRGWVALKLRELME